MPTKSERAKNCKDLIKNETRKINVGQNNQSITVEHIVFIGGCARRRGENREIDANIRVLLCNVLTDV